MLQRTDNTAGDAPQFEITKHTREGEFLGVLKEDGKEAIYQSKEDADYWARHLNQCQGVIRYEVREATNG